MNLMRIIEANLATLVLAVIGGLLAYVIGTTKTGTRLDALEAEVATNKAFNDCAVRHFDHIESGATGVMPCQLR